MVVFTMSPFIRMIGIVSVVERKKISVKINLSTLHFVIRASAHVALSTEFSFSLVRNLIEYACQ